MKVIFMGTPDFAVPALRRLIKEHEVVCVYTREPKIAGRGNKLCKSPVQEVAEANAIMVRTPKTLRDAAAQAEFAALKADVAVVAAYGLILPTAILQACPYGCLNLHASLLPRWRGAAPIQRCIEAGDSQSGVTIMRIAEGLDTGDMLHKGIVAITPQMTSGELHDRLALLGADLISAVLADITKYPAVPQDESKACYAAKIDKAECSIDFNIPAAKLINKIRAFNPYPAVFFSYNGERFKILVAEEVKDMHAPAGTIISGTKELIIACQDNAIRVTQIQRQGKKSMATAELLRGFAFTENARL